MCGLLHAHYLARNFLLLGPSFTDPNLEHVFKLVRLMQSEGPREHYAILRIPTDPYERRARSFKVRELERVGIHTVEFTEVLLD